MAAPVVTASLSADETLAALTSGRASSEADIVAREIPLDLRYTGPGGALQTALVTSRVRSGAQKRDSARMTAALCRGAEWEALPPDAREVAYQYGVVVYSIVELTSNAGRPADGAAWILQAMDDDEFLLSRLYQEVAAHEAAYWFRDDGEDSPPTRRSDVAVRRVRGYRRD